MRRLGSATWLAVAACLAAGAGPVSAQDVRSQDVGLISAQSDLGEALASCTRQSFDLEIASATFESGATTLAPESTAELLAEIKALLAEAPQAPERIVVVGDAAGDGVEAGNPILELVRAIGVARELRGKSIAPAIAIDSRWIPHSPRHVSQSPRDSAVRVYAQFTSAVPVDTKLRDAVRGELSLYAANGGRPAGSNIFAFDTEWPLSGRPLPGGALELWLLIDPAAQIAEGQRRVLFSLTDRSVLVQGELIEGGRAVTITRRALGQPAAEAKPAAEASSTPGAATAEETATPARREPKDAPAGTSEADAATPPTTPGEEAFTYRVDLADGVPHHLMFNDLMASAELWVDGTMVGSRSSGVRLSATDGKLLALGGGTDADRDAPEAWLTGVRLWRNTFDCGDIRALMPVRGVPEVFPRGAPVDQASDRFVENPLLTAMAGNLVATSKRGETGLVLRLAEPTIALVDEAFVEFGTERAYRRADNAGGAASLGEAAPKIYRDNFFGPRGKEHGAYPHYPVFIVEQRDAIVDRAVSSAFAGRRDRTQMVFDALIPRDSTIAGIELSYADLKAADPRLAPETASAKFGYIQGLRIAFRRAGQNAVESTPWFGTDEGQVGRKAFPCVGEFSSDVEILGMRGFADADRVYDLNLITRSNLDYAGCMKGSATTLQLGQRFSLWVPDGAKFAGFKVAAPLAISGLAVEGDIDPRRGAIVMTREDGKREFFEQIGPNVFQSRSAQSILPQDIAVPYPKLTIVSPNLFAVEGVSRDFVTSGERPDPIGDKAFFDDTFVSNFKAVNLRASFGSYHAARMDPLQLLNRGSEKTVFKMPAGDSRDYHDFDRIFVPDGLLFIPEFSGRNESKTTRADTLTEFKQHFSSTVGLGVGGSVEGVGGAFNFSETMQQAREKMNEQNKTIAVGTAKVALYSLMLDKAAMQLDPEFMQRIYRLVGADDAAFDRFIDAYGTHYAYGVEYGGLGVLQANVTKSVAGTKTFNSREFELGFKAEIEGASANESYKQENSVNNGIQESKEVELEDFYWVGGAHGGGTRESWGVGEDGAVPVYVQLRPLDELLAPPYFLDPEIVNNTRLRLAARIQRVIADVSRQDNAERLANQENLFQVTMLGFRTISPGDDGAFDDQLEIYGHLEMSMSASIRRLEADLPFFNRVRDGSQYLSVPLYVPGAAATVWSPALVLLIFQTAINAPTGGPHDTSNAQLLGSVPGEAAIQSVTVKTKDIASAAITLSGQLTDADDLGPDDPMTISGGRERISLGDVPIGGALRDKLVFNIGRCSESCTTLEVDYEVTRHAAR